MPKDATKNIDRYKIRGGTLNEYEFEQGKTADRKQRAADNWPQQAGAPQGMKSAPTKNAPQGMKSAPTKNASKGNKSASKGTKNALGAKSAVKGKKTASKGTKNAITKSASKGTKGASKARKSASKGSKKK